MSEEKESESTIRFKVRREWIEEGCLTVHKSYPLDSLERSIALDESHKIRFEEKQSL